MSEQRSSNPLVAALRNRHEAPYSTGELLLRAADEIERLTIERDNAISQAQFAQSERERLTAERDAQYEQNIEQIHRIGLAEAERDRLTATVEELRTVSAGLRAALQDLYDCQSSSDGATQWRAKFDSAMKRASKALAGAAVENKDPQPWRCRARSGNETGHRRCVRRKGHKGEHRSA